MEIRSETATDHAAIDDLTTRAFDGIPHGSGREGEIIQDLRRDGALTLSLVCDIGGKIVGHIALSPVTIEGRDLGWYGLGPLAVDPHWQGKGLGGALVRDAIARIKEMGAKGIVVLGDPTYYARFGFAPDAGLILPDVPPDYFQALPFGDPVQGMVLYHPTFH